MGDLIIHQYLTTTELFHGIYLHVTIFTLVASQVSQYATTPGKVTVISTANAWGEATTQMVASGG